MSKSKTQNKVLLFVICALLLFCHLCFVIWDFSFAQEGDIEFNLDVTSNTTPLPKIFKPSIDLSGRGFNSDASWPQTVAAKEVLEKWQKDIGFGNIYRMQYSLWDIQQLSADKDSQNKLLANYEKIIKDISDAGGIVILDIFGTPAGLGKVLDKKAPPKDLRSFKQLIKNTIRNLSCAKRYNIWYEIWSAPDLDSFFLGRKQEYFNLYRQIAESINELKQETKVHIPLGGPSVSWWFQNLDGNTIATPEQSLVYELIKFCYHYHLPLDFISWHAFTSDPAAEKAATIYKKSAVKLVRDWLSYFNFDRNTPLVIDEWNYDRDANILPARNEKSFICASFIPSRIKNMYEAGIDYQLYFSLEDFQNNKEGVVRNTGIFWFDSGGTGYHGGSKAIYNVFRMLAGLGKDMFATKLDDEFAGVIATKSQDSIILIIYNYIDPEIVMGYLSRNIANLNKAERKILLKIIQSDKMDKILLRQIDVAKLHATNKIRNLLKKVRELNDRAKKFELDSRNMKISIKGLKENYLYQRYAIDSSCSLNCEFIPCEQKEINASPEPYKETLSLKPYSVHLVVLNKKPKETEPIAPETTTKETAPQAVAKDVDIDAKQKENTEVNTNSNSAANGKKE